MLLKAEFEKFFENLSADGGLLMKQSLQKKSNALSVHLLGDIRSLIQQAREHVAVAVNSATVLLYWQIGKRIREDVLKQERAEYGKQIFYTLSRKLTEEFGGGWGEKHLRHCTRFAEIFSDEEIVYTLCRQLSWSHLRAIMYLEDSLKREFYIEMCKIERWSVRTLSERISSMLYERTAISKKPDQLIRKELKELRDDGKMTPDLVFRDPYFLNFLGLKDTYSEKNLESAILSEIESFILELGIGFSFIARQKKITVDGDEYYIDLLFYHRTLRRLVAIDLKLDKFKPAYKGQMELYLRWLEKYEMQKREELPIGLILCAGKSSEQIELLQLHKSGIRVSEYLTELPSRKVLERKLHQAIIAAKEQILHRTTK